MNKKIFKALKHYFLPSSLIPHPSSLPLCVRMSINEEIEGEKKNAIPGIYDQTDARRFDAARL
jgi:hypothetical protein